MNTECEVRKALGLLLLSKGAWAEAEKKGHCGTEKGRFYVVPSAISALIGPLGPSNKAIGKVLKEYSLGLFRKMVSGHQRFWYCIDLAAVAEAFRADFMGHFCRRWGISQDEFFGVEAEEEDGAVHGEMTDPEGP